MDPLNSAPGRPFAKRWFAAGLLAVLLGTSLLAVPAPNVVRPTFTFKRGVSIAHWMAKIPDGAELGAAWFGPADLDWIAAQGFDHVRFPVDGRLVWRADHTLDEARLAPLVRALDATKARGLGAVLDLHFLPGGRFQKDTQDPAIFTDPAARAEAAACWARLAERFRAEGAFLRFELINEPFAPDAAQLNTLNRALLAAVRQHDPARVVYVTTNLSSTFATLPDLQVPDDPHVAILLHYDEPAVFTHQRASWKGCPPDMPVVEFPGRVPDLRGLFPEGHFAHRASLTELTVAGIRAEFARAAAWLQAQAPGREVYLGEFGVYEAAPAESRTRYIRAVSEAAADLGWGWCVWSYNGGMAVRDTAGRPTPVLAGLFPNGRPAR
jgi:endoglucanase